MIYTNATGGWTANVSVNYTSDVMTNFTTRQFSNGIYNWSVWCNDTAGNLKQHGSNYTLTVDTAAPAINWVNSTGYPANISNNNSITFYVNATDANPDSCMIYTNATGGWNKNVSVSYTSDSMATFATQTFSDGVYNWSVWCNDTAGNVKQHVRNYTLLIDGSIPTIAFRNPTNAKAL